MSWLGNLIVAVICLVIAVALVWGMGKDKKKPDDHKKDDIE